LAPTPKPGSAEPGTADRRDFEIDAAGAVRGRQRREGPLGPAGSEAVDETEEPQAVTLEWWPRRLRVEVATLATSTGSWHRSCPPPQIELRTYELAQARQVRCEL